MKTLFAALILCLASAAAAQTIIYEVPLSGDQESPPVATNGTGMAFVTLDPATGVVTVEGFYMNLSAPAIDAHIHSPAPRGKNTGVSIPLMQSGGTAGGLAGFGMLAGAQVQDMLNGLAYVNVHSSMHQGGEIRGQIDSVSGSGHPQAAPVTVNGTAQPGGALDVDCPPGQGMDFVVVGLALPPGQVDLLNIPELCMPGPAGVAIDLQIPPIAFPGSSVNIPLPMPFPAIELAIQCATITPGNCVQLSRAVRVAIRP